jgi:hypothetical protein
MRCDRTTVLFAVVVAVTAPIPAPPDQLSIPVALELYQAGDWSRGLKAIDSRALTVDEFTSTLETWTRGTGAASQPRGRSLAAAFALDVVWTATRDTAHEDFVTLAPGGKYSLSDRRSLGAVAVWAARQMPSAGAVTVLERPLWLASIGIAQDGNASDALKRQILPLALARLPNEPRLRLADVVASADLDLGPLFPVTMRHLNFSVLRPEALPARAAGHIAGAIRSLQGLLSEDAVAAEVELRIGYLELRRRRWPEAIARFTAVSEKTSDPILLATADYMAGWVHEQAGDLDRAIAAYRRALALTPTMRNLATHLSALLFLRDERAEAYSILDHALNARPIPVDLLTSLERGDSRFVEGWLATVRSELRQTHHF